MKALMRQYLRLLWEGEPVGVADTSEDARLLRAMREHPEYSDLWRRLDELSEEEIERDGTNPIMHIVMHSTVEGQIADNEPKAVRRTLEPLLRQGLDRHEAIHRLAEVLAEEMYYVLVQGRPFDQRSYVRKLRDLVK
jgi:hypothetical protein